MLKLNKTAAALAAALCIFQVNAQAQVQVIESKPDQIKSSPYRAAPAAASAVASTAPDVSNNIQSEMFYRLQLLQEEVLELRGMLEEQANEIKRLKQQRLDDYVDFDRRLNAIGQGAGSVATDIAPAASALAAAGSLPAADELAVYRSAIDAVLKQKDYQKASSEFNAYLQQFPSGQYAPNALYWLGEIALVDNNLEQARQKFTRLLTAYPDHTKTFDARFKLGTIYYNLGDKPKAKQILTELSQTSSNAARLAQDFLREHFK